MYDTSTDYSSRRLVYCWNAIFGDLVIRRQVMSDMEKLREDVAQWLFFRDWDKEFTTMIYFNGDWGEGLEEW